jgi:hypothetical protein
VIGQEVKTIPTCFGPTSAPLPGDVLSRMIGGDLLSYAIGVVASLGVADELAEGARTAAVLGDAVGADPVPLNRFLRCLAAHGVFDDLGDARYALNAVSSLLCRDNHDSLADWAQLRTELAGPLATAMLHSARTGDCAFEKVHKAGFYEYLAGHPDLEVPWNNAMEGRARRLGRYLLEVVDWRDVATVADVGGHTGALLAVLLGGIDVAGTVFDQPYVAAEAQYELGRAGLGDRSKAVGGDFFVSVPPGADRYVLANVICDWPDDHARTILSNCRDAMTPSARLVVCEPILPDGPSAPAVTMADLVQFVLLGGEIRDRPAWNALLHASGLRLTNIRVGPEWSVIEAGIR